MANEKEMTWPQLEQQLREMRRLYASAQLLQADAARDWTKQDPPPCFSRWGRQAACEVCVARQALEQKTRRTRLEYAGQELYEVSAEYVRVEGSPCVLESVRRVEPELLMQFASDDRLSESMAAYRSRLYRDVLTGAYNRRYYDEKYSGVKITAGVAILDLDDFKLCNDIYGSYAGDVVLETMVGVVRRCLSEKDCIIRYGGDELLLILPDVERAQLPDKLERIRLQLGAAVVPGFSRIRISVSIGGLWVKDTLAGQAVQRAEQLRDCARVQKNMVITEQQVQAEEEPGLRPRQSVLIVDDSAINRTLLTGMLGGQFDTAEAASGEACLQMLEQNSTGVSIVLLDIHMSGIDGFAVLEEMNRRGLLDVIPVIMISSEDNVDAVRRAFDLGASDYISRPFDAKVVYQRITNTIRLYSKQRRLSAMAADQVYEKEKSSRMMLGILSQMVQYHNGESPARARRIHTLTTLLLEHLVQKTDDYQLSQTRRTQIAAAAALQDVGKIRVEERILKKKGRLTPQETQALRLHTRLGAEMLEEMPLYPQEEFLQTAAQVCRWHHERYDGSGYPDGLKGEQIPLAAQAAGLADAYDALLNGGSGEAACRTALQKLCADGAAFNPLLLECMREIEPQVCRAMQEISDNKR